MVPIDHGATLGPIQGINNSFSILKELNEGGCDAVILHKGLLKLASRYEELCNTKYILHLSVSTDKGPDIGYKVLASRVEEAIKLGAEAVSVHVNIGNEKEYEMIKDLGRVSEACTDWGLPLLAMMYSTKKPRDYKEIAHAARLAEELGADMVKIGIPDDYSNLEKIINNVNIPVVVAGGDKMDSAEKLLNTINMALNSGVAGIAIGRNIFQYEQPKNLMNLVKGLINNELNVKECIDHLNKPLAYSAR